MKSKKDDIEIRQLFDSLREEDLEKTPSFHSLLARETRDKREGWFSGRLGLRVAGVLALVLLAIFPTLVLLRNDTPALDVEVVSSLYEWESPTDFLLGLSEEPLLSEVPTLEPEVAELLSSEDAVSAEM